MTNYTIPRPQRVLPDGTPIIGIILLGLAVGHSFITNLTNWPYVGFFLP